MICTTRRGLTRLLHEPQQEDGKRSPKLGSPTPDEQVRTKGGRPRPRIGHPALHITPHHTTQYDAHTRGKWSGTLAIPGPEFPHVWSFHKLHATNVDNSMRRLQKGIDYSQPVTPTPTVGTSGPSFLNGHRATYCSPNGFPFIGSKGDWTQAVTFNIASRIRGTQRSNSIRINQGGETMLETTRQ
jgi:hypothetical protein